METLSERTADRPNQALGRRSPINRPTIILGGILFLALLLNLVRAQDAILPSSYSITLAWTGSPSPAAIGYLIYYGTASGQYSSCVDVGNVTTNTVQGLAGATTYFFAVSSYDTNGVESSLSNEISYVPGPSTVGISATATGQIALTVNGLIGQSYEILAAQTLTNWVVIGTVTLGASGSAVFTDTKAVRFPTRFYCIQQIP
jgi:hypothetical protein